MTLHRITRPSDALTPVRAYAALRGRGEGEASFLFESVISGERWGRYSILGYRPRYEVLYGWDGFEIRGDLPEGKSLGQDTDPLKALSSLLQGEAGRGVHPAERFAGGHVGFFAWDLVHRIARVPPGDPGTWKRHFLPLLRVLGGAVIVAFDNLDQTFTVCADDEARVARALADLESDPRLSSIRLPDRACIPRDVTVDMDDGTFCERVLAAQEHIRAGDAFQIVLARTFTVPQHGRDAFDVYRAMRLVNPSPYMYFLDFPPAKGEATRTRIAGASPETLVRLEDGTMTVRPIAGTRPRGKTHEQDVALAEELLADPKERAEHVMLVDLGRNDVGCVSSLGTVELVRCMDIERYSHVMHIVSEVRGQVRPGIPATEVLRAGFPAGTLSGAPKVRAMQIIRELEARPRGIYGGAIGYVASTGDLDFAIAIRTAVCREGRFDVTAGAGVVDASVPEREAEETRGKARGVLCAIEAVDPVNPSLLPSQ